jgi:protein phosphatase
LTGFDQLEHAVRTDVGVRRSHNQDAYAIDPAGDADRFAAHGHLFLVADGMGGHAVGEKASAKAVRDIPHTYHKHAQEGPAQAIRKAFAEANAGIHAIGQENPEFRGLGTTGTALLLRPEGAWVGHVGDSRAYRIRDGVIEQLSFDHSAVWEIARRQQVNPEELQGIRSNVILRSLGPDAFVEVDVEGPHPVQAGDIYLVCSDGLTGQLSDYEIGAVAAALPPTEACEFLVELANLRGGPDNITVVIVHVGGTPGMPEASPPTAPRPRPRRSIPWPLTMLAIGVFLALLALVLITSELPGGKHTFVLATAAIGVGCSASGCTTRGWRCRSRRNQGRRHFGSTAPRGAGSNSRCSTS